MKCKMDFCEASIFKGLSSVTRGNRTPAINGEKYSDFKGLSV